MAPEGYRQSTRLPHPLTSFVGRAAELDQIHALLREPSCRLLTLVGSGGIGKSRLALEVAAQAADHFADGVCYVPLEAVEGQEAFFAALADAFQITLAGPLSPLQQIVSLLRDQPHQIRQLLVLLDNFERLLAEATFLSTLLQQCSGLKLIVTSREVLNLQEEWLYLLQGLPFPAGNDDEFGACDSVRLFVERARARRAHFSPGDEYPTIGRICRMVEGMPLAIELAASWIRDMNCADIAAEIERNIVFLNTRLRNIPERHRSLQAVFEQTWKMLTADEQKSFSALSVFVNGFHWEAAQQVTGTSLPMLTGLVDKSLLRVDAQGRYRFHSLLRQYAYTRLESNSEAEEEARERHCAYYLNLVIARAEAIVDGRQQEALREIAAELDNVRAAWQWAVAQERLADLKEAAITMQSFFDFQSRFREAVETFESAIERLDHPPLEKERSLTLAALLTVFGWSAIRMGRIEEARRSFARSRQIYADLNTEIPAAWGSDPLPGLGLVAAIQGDYTRSTELASEAEKRCLARRDRQNLQLAYYVWQTAAYAQGDYTTARRYAEQAYALTEAAGNRWMMAYILSELGNIARATQEIAQARRYYTASYEIKEALTDSEGMASVLNQLARTVQMEGKFAEAAQLYARSESLYRKIYDRGGLVNALHGLGETAFLQGEGNHAASYLREALQIAHEMAWTPLILTILVSVAQLLQAAGESAHSLALLKLVVHQPAAEHQTRRRAQTLIDTYVPADSELSFTESAKPDDLAKTVSKIYLMLSTLDFEKIPATSIVEKKEQPLVEPLTQRELEVLQQMAEGLTNQEIAERLIVAIGTVKSYTSQIYGKLGVRNRMEAVARAKEIALI